MNKRIQSSDYEKIYVKNLSEFTVRCEKYYEMENVK